MSQLHSHRRVIVTCRAGFSLLEASISVMLVGLLMVVALQSFGSSKRREGDTVDRLLGQQLASALVNEILLHAYQDPGAAPLFGPEAGESGGTRALFDDVDDYSGWNSSPPAERSGSTIPGLTGWTRTVSVTWADPVTLGATTAIKTGLKKITVATTKSGRLMATMTAYRSIAWVDTIPSPSDMTGNHAPVAVATSPDLTRKVGESVTFAASASSDEDGDYLSFVWNFGDGATESVANTSHRFNTPGNFNCTVTVYDGRGGVGTTTLTAVISP